MHWAVIVLISILAVFIIGLVIFSWRNAAASVKPKLIPKEREIAGNKVDAARVHFMISATF